MAKLNLQQRRRGSHGSSPGLYRRSASDDAVPLMDTLDGQGRTPSMDSYGGFGTAADVLRVLTPGCDPSVYMRLRREHIATASELACLDKDDLREVGLSMVERSRIMRWANSRQRDEMVASKPQSGNATDDDTPDVAGMVDLEPPAGTGALLPLAQTPDVTPNAADLSSGEEAGFGLTPDTSPDRHQRPQPIDEDAPPATAAGTSAQPQGVARSHGGSVALTPPKASASTASASRFVAHSPHLRPIHAPRRIVGMEPSVSLHKSLTNVRSHREALVTIEEHLDEAEQRADFWCSIVTSVAPPKPKAVQRRSESECSEEVSDLRENVLEELFDLSAERVEQLYYGMLGGSPCMENLSLDALRQGLHRCGLPNLEIATLERMMAIVNQGQASATLGLAEFEAILSRLKLAQLLSGVCRLPLDKETLGGRRIVLGGSVVRPSAREASELLTVIDYSSQTAQTMRVPKAKHREFFFGHRKRLKGTDLPLVRWVHMSGLDLTLLLALTVKYGLHPLSIEDVIEQCPTKIDRFGCHYFAAVEQLCLVGAMDGSEPVRVHGRHVAIFCSGPPLFDTILTVTEPDHDEKEDWPGGSVRDNTGAGDAWVERLHLRLNAAHSRVRERRADYLMYQILDLAADEYVKVMKAYTTRLSWLEEQPHITATGLVPAWTEEVSLIELQLAVVVRRMKGLQRLIRRVGEDADLQASLNSYVTDIKDHVEEALEDATYLSEKCRSLLEHSERELELHQAYVRQCANDELNTRIFILTVASSIFSPMHFITAVYGMNFSIDGKPTIPELKWGHGYVYFWLLVSAYLLGSGFTAMWLWKRWKKAAERDMSTIAGAENWKVTVTTTRIVPERRTLAKAGSARPSTVR